MAEGETQTRRTPLISVVVPAYNAAGTVLETIDSICRQTFIDFELIIINDGSTDGTLARLQSVTDPRLRIVTCLNQGLAAARNRGIELAEGEFISFIDADDLWTPDKLELQLQALRGREGAALAYSWTAFVDSNGRFLFAKEPSRFEGEVYEDLLRNCNFVASGSNMLVRRSCAMSVGGFDTTLEAAHDWDFCQRIAARWPFALVPRYQILYRISENAMSADPGRAERNCLLLCGNAIERNRVSRASSAMSFSGVKQYAAFLYLTRATGPDFRREAGRKLTESIRLYPPTLLTGKTWHLLLTWFVLGALPKRRQRSAVLMLLRIFGRWSWIWRREVRRLAAFSGEMTSSAKTR